MDEQAIPQWMLWVTIEHGPKFQHRIHISTVDKNNGPYRVATWTWQGVGVPPALLTDCEARVASVLDEHIVTRYGVAQSLRWD